MGFLDNKKALIIGVASNRSIAWGVAQAMHNQGAELAFTYQNDRLQSRVEKLAKECDSDIVLPCDVSTDENIDALFTQLKTHWPEFDILVHSVAFAPKEELEGDFVENTTREGSRLAHEISSYSLTALAKAARPMMRGHASAIIAFDPDVSTELVADVLEQFKRRRRMTQMHSREIFYQ